MGEKVTVPKRGIILGGGEIQNYATIASLIQPNDLIICADSGYHHCKPLGIKPSLLVGDFDSIGVIPTDVPKVPLPENKNYTDTTFSVEGAIQQGCDQILLIGMLGGRLDHTLANLQSLIYCTNHDISSYITDGNTQVFCLTATLGDPKSCTLAPLEGYYFSLISFSDCCTSVSIEGGKYPLKDHNLTNDLARAVSNEFVGKDVTITVEEGTLLILLVPMD